MAVLYDQPYCHWQRALVLLLQCLLPHRASMRRTHNLVIFHHYIYYNIGAILHQPCSPGHVRTFTESIRGHLHAPGRLQQGMSSRETRCPFLSRGVRPASRLMGSPAFSCRRQPRVASAPRALRRQNNATKTKGYGCGAQQCWARSWICWTSSAANHPRKL